MLKKISFIVLIIGFFILFLLLEFLPVYEIINYEELQGLEINSKVSVDGLVSNERVAGDLLIMQINGIEVMCSKCKPGFKGKEIEVLGIIGEYEGERQIEVIRISMLS